MAKPKPSGTPALDVLVREGVPYGVHDYHHDPAQRSFGDETAAALGLPPEQIFKTLLVEVSGGGRPELVVGIVPVSGQLDLKALAAAAGGKKAVLAEPSKAERATGYVVGGISPLGQKTQLRTFVDASAVTFETVYVSAGKRGQQVELAPSDLVRLTQATVAPIGRSG